MGDPGGDCALLAACQDFELNEQEVRERSGNADETMYAYWSIESRRTLLSFNSSSFP